MRVACLFIPNFALAAWLRAEPELCGVPVVVTAGKGGRALVVSMSPQAAQSGVSAGMSAAQATAIASTLVLRPACADAERAAQAALCDVAQSLSPRVEDAGGGMVYLDCEGLQSLHGSERDLARALVGAGMRVGLEIYVGIASTRIVARLAAQEGGGVTVVPCEEEWRFLSPLPIEVLAPPPPIRQRLARWGIRSLGDLIALPASAVATRLGSEGERLARRARGEDERPLTVRPAPLHFEEAADLGYGIETLEALGFVLRASLDRLTTRLALRGFVCGELHLALRLTNHARDERTVTVAVPSNDVKALLALVRLQLEARPPTAPVEAIRLAADAEQLRAAQLDLFRPHGPAPRRLAVTLARLNALCGTGRIGIPAVADSHRPDDHGQVTGFRLQVTGDRGQASGSRLQASGRNTLSSLLRPHSPFRIPHSAFRIPNLPVLALRAIRPPRRLDVFTDQGRPDFVRPCDVSDAVVSPVQKPRASVANQPPFSSPLGKGGAKGVSALGKGGVRGVSISSEKSPTRDYSCSGRVVTAAGPWRVEGSWWDSEAFSRDYYDVQLSDGVIYRLFYEGARQAWFVDGVYD